MIVRSIENNGPKQYLMVVLAYWYRRIWSIVGIDGKIEAIRYARENNIPF